MPDPYRFLPALGELDLHLIGEGRHEQLWQALGAQPMTHEGVAGTRFTVWAPNAQGVRVATDFTHWDGTQFPMRSLGASGVWELFLPGVGEGTPYKFEIHSRYGHRFLKADPMARACRGAAEHGVDRDGLALRVGRRRVDGTPRRQPGARGALVGVRGASGVLAAGADLPAAGRGTPRVRQGPGLHARGADAGRRAPLPRRRGATRSPVSTRRPRGWARRTTSGSSSTPVTGRASA